MAFPHRIFFPFFLLVFLQAGPLFAQSLDIFNTLKPFPPILPVLGENNFDLDRLQEEEIPTTLQHYENTWSNTKSRDEKNLLALAVGYLHYLNKNHQAAGKTLEKNIVGNFILEDFRIHYLALAYKEQGRQELENKKYPLAIDLFKKSEKLRMKIFHSYPDSPFFTDVSRDLAEVEYLLGEGYFQALNYRAAWQAFRRSLMRDFPDHDEHKLKVNLALAKNYQSAGDLKSAADIYASILTNAESSEALEPAYNFFRVYEDRLKKGKIDLKGLKLKPPVSPTATDRIDKRRTARKKKKVTYQNPMVRNFYQSLDQDDEEATLKSGLEVLKNVPGIQEAEGVTKLLNHLLVSYLKDHDGNGLIDEITSLYPARSLNDLGYALWKEEFPDRAAVFYEKIIKQYPLEISACHKAMFYLGRIAEDNGEYAKAVEYYEELLKKYDFGPFTTAALFKIPWIYRLEKKFDLARAHFIRLQEFYSSPAYKRLKAVHKNASYQVEGQYWLAQTQGALGNQKEKIKGLKSLAEKHPFHFYTIFTQDESGFDLKQFLTRNASQEVAFRLFGLGEIDRKRLSRAEQLIAVGFRGHGVEELAKLSFKKDDPAFSFYIVHLLKLGGNFQDSMRLSWKITSRGNHDRLTRSLSEGLFPKAFHGEVREILKNYNLDPLLVLSLMRQESAFNPKIISKANAIGLMQLMPATAKEVARSLKQKTPSEEDLKNPVTNVRLGIDYLNYLMGSFNNNMVYALAAYNAGPTKVKQWMTLRPNLHPLEFVDSIPYSETRNYVKKVLRNYAIYLTLYEGQEIARFKEILTIQTN
ncbi:MAG: hypothetical protein NPINA01_12450 [Nitrospinaceae bacterium]|nr:MAG: hypothetical protein NPINA01_12450 [Nitrospinaceae bacterium]